MQSVELGIASALSSPWKTLTENFRAIKKYFSLNAWKQLSQIHTMQMVANTSWQYWNVKCFTRKCKIQINLLSFCYCDDLRWILFYGSTRWSIPPPPLRTKLRLSGFQISSPGSFTKPVNGQFSTSDAFFVCREKSFKSFSDS